MEVPYFGQWESRELITDLLLGKRNAAEDPLWHLSGASNREEYAIWSWHICGMACLKMHLAHQKGQIIPTIHLMKACQDYGGYVVNENNEIDGLYYRPFVTFIKERFGIVAEVKEYTSLEKVCNFLEQGHVFIASVHPSIRTPEQIPPRQGGHLVYVFGRNHERKEIIFHNPSGNSPTTQENVHLNDDLFKRFYAERGILIKSSEDTQGNHLL